MPIKRLQQIRLASVAILGLVLTAGFLLGAVWNRWIGPEAPAVTSEEPAGERRSEASWRRAMYSQVTPPLSPEDLATAQAIVARRRAAAQALFREPRIDSLYDAMKAAERAFREVYDPRFRALVDDSRAAIRQLMTPEQAQVYDSLLAERDRRRREGGG